MFIICVRDSKDISPVRQMLLLTIKIKISELNLVYRFIFLWFDHRSFGSMNFKLRWLVELFNNINGRYACSVIFDLIFPIFLIKTCKFVIVGFVYITIIHFQLLVLYHSPLDRIQILICIYLFIFKQFLIAYFICCLVYVRIWQVIINCSKLSVAVAVTVSFAK